MKLLLTLLVAVVLLTACTTSPTGTDGLTPSLPVYSFPDHPHYKVEYKMICMDSTRYDLLRYKEYVFSVHCDWEGNWDAYIHPSGPSLNIENPTQLYIIGEMQKINYGLLRDFPGQTHHIDSLNFF
jgi:hypothetical protein